MHLSKIKCKKMILANKIICIILIIVLLSFSLGCYLIITQIQIRGYVINELLSNIKEKSQKSDSVPNLCAREEWAHFSYLYVLYLICLFLSIQKNVRVIHCLVSH